MFYNSRNYKVFIDLLGVLINLYSIYNSRNYKVFIDLNAYTRACTDLQ